MNEKVAKALVQANVVQFGEFTLASGQSIKFSVTLRAPENFSRDSMYGGVFVTASQPESGLSSASVLSRLGALFFVRVGGDFKTDGSLVNFGTINNKKFFWKGNLSFVTAFQNTGTVHLNPYGGITLKNIFNKFIGETEIKPWFVLPEATRSRVVEADNVGWKFGLYKAVLELNRGYDDVVDRREISFVVIAWQWLIMFAVAFSGGLWWFLHRRLMRNI